MGQRKSKKMGRCRPNNKNRSLLDFEVGRGERRSLTLRKRPLRLPLSGRGAT
jgi:hypothetical protein